MAHARNAEPDFGAMVRDHAARLIAARSRVLDPRLGSRALQLLDKLQNALASDVHRVPGTARELCREFDQNARAGARDLALGELVAAACAGLPRDEATAAQGFFAELLLLCDAMYMFDGQPEFPATGHSAGLARWIRSQAALARLGDPAAAFPPPPGRDAERHPQAAAAR